MNKKILSAVLVMGVAAGALPSTRAQAASASANAVQSVIAAIAIAKVSDLDFGEAPQGDGAKVLAVSDSGAAQFTVSGEPNRAYTITLPSSVTMTTAGGGAANKQIQVNSFTSNPNGTGTIGAGGSQTLKVGASRAALASDQVAGSYTGTFSVSVVY